MTCNHRLLSSAAVFLLSSGVIQAQSETTYPSWNAQPQTTSPATQQQMPIRTGAQRAAPASAGVRQGNAEQLQGMPPNSDQNYTERMPLDQQIAILRQQLRELQQRLSASEQRLATHQHSYLAPSFGRINYATFQLKLENHPDELMPWPQSPQRTETSPPITLR